MGMYPDSDMVPVQLGHGNVLWVPACRCWVTKPDTAESVRCPLHGIVKIACSARETEPPPSM